MKQATLALLLALMPIAPGAMANENISKVNGGIRAEAGQNYGNLDTVNGGITVESGVTARNINTVNGGIRIGDNVHAGSVETVNGGITLGRNVTLSGGMETVNGSIFSDHGGRIGGGVETVNGSIGLVGTSIDGDIETVGGSITVGLGSEVRGGIYVRKPGFSLSLTAPRKPRVIIGPNAVVRGDLEFEREVVLYVHRSAKIGRVKGASMQIFDTDTAPRN